MHKSLFHKYLILTTSIIMVSFLIMGSVLYISVTNYWISDKYDNLADSATAISEFSNQKITKDYEGNYKLSSEIPFIMKTMGSSFNAKVYITNIDGEIILTSNSQPDKYLGKIVDTDIVNKAAFSNYRELTNLKGLFSSDHYMVGVPLSYGEDREADVIGAVFVASSAENYGYFRTDIIQMTLIATLFAALISLTSAGVLSYRMILPIREISAAVINFGNGDFTRRVKVRNNDEIGELAIAFNNMATSLSTSENMSRSFVANVSHELKTPMTTISGFIDGILDGTIPPERQKQYLQIVSVETKRLSRLVRSMLDLSKIDSGKMKIHCIRFDIKETIITTMLSFEKRIDEKNIDIAGLDEIDNTFIYGDPDLIYQVIYNLIENAIKFVDNGGRITVSLFEQNNQTHIKIGNTGPGIPVDDLPLIFDRFYKTDQSRSKDKNGMGLGLFLVKTIIKLHSGDVAVRSAENQYTEFEFFIPKNDNEE